MDSPPVTQDAAPFRLERTSKTLCIRMGASLANIDAADAQLADFLAQAGSGVDRFAARILLREAALNAVTHGSGEDPAREVRIRAAIGADGLELTVEDDGPGFTWQGRGAAFDITGDGGRGLALMQIYSSTMSFNDRGNRVVLRRGFGADAPGPSA